MSKNTQLIIYEIIKPFLLNENIENYLIDKINTNYNNRCLDCGFIKKINKLIIDKNAEVSTSDLSGNLKFKILLDVDLINFNIGDIIECKITKIDKQLDMIISNNIIYENEINLPFLILIINIKNKNIKIDDIVKVEIKAKKVDTIENKLHFITELVKK